MASPARKCACVHGTSPVGKTAGLFERQVRKNSVLRTDEAHKCAAKRSIVGNGFAWALVYIAEFMWAMRGRIRLCLGGL